MNKRESSLYDYATGVALISLSLMSMLGLIFLSDFLVFFFLEAGFILGLLYMSFGLIGIISSNNKVEEGE